MHVHGHLWDPKMSSQCHLQLHTVAVILGNISTHTVQIVADHCAPFSWVDLRTSILLHMHEVWLYLQNLKHNRGLRMSVHCWRSEPPFTHQADIPFRRENDKTIYYTNLFTRRAINCQLCWPFTPLRRILISSVILCPIIRQPKRETGLCCCTL